MNPLGYITGTIGLALLLALAVQSYRLNSALREVAEGQVLIERLRNNNVTLAGNQTRLQASLDAQNAAVAGLKAASDKASQEATAAATAIRSETAKARENVAALRTLLASARQPIPFLKSWEMALDEARKPDQ